MYIFTVTKSKTKYRFCQLKNVWFWITGQSAQCAGGGPVSVFTRHGSVRGLCLLFQIAISLLSETLPGAFVTSNIDLGITWASTPPSHHDKGGEVFETNMKLIFVILHKIYVLVCLIWNLRFKATEGKRKNQYNMIKHHYDGQTCSTSSSVVLAHLPHHVGHSLPRVWQLWSSRRSLTWQVWATSLKIELLSLSWQATVCRSPVPTDQRDVSCRQFTTKYLLLLGSVEQE